MPGEAGKKRPGVLWRIDYSESAPLAVLEVRSPRESESQQVAYFRLNLEGNEPSPPEIWVENADYWTAIAGVWGQNLLLARYPREDMPEVEGLELYDENGEKIWESNRGTLLELAMDGLAYMEGEEENWLVWKEGELEVVEDFTPTAPGISRLELPQKLQPEGLGLELDKLTRISQGEIYGPIHEFETESFQIRGWTTRLPSGRFDQHIGIWQEEKLLSMEFLEDEAEKIAPDLMVKISGWVLAIRQRRTLLMFQDQENRS